MISFTCQRVCNWILSSFTLVRTLKRFNLWACICCMPAVGQCFEFLQGRASLLFFLTLLKCQIDILTISIHHRGAVQWPKVTSGEHCSITEMHCSAPPVSVVVWTGHIKTLRWLVFIQGWKLPVATPHRPLGLCEERSGWITFQWVVQAQLTDIQTVILLPLECFGFFWESNECFEWEYCFTTVSVWLPIAVWPHSHEYVTRYCLLNITRGSFLPQHFVNWMPLQLKGGGWGEAQPPFVTTFRP